METTMTLIAPGLIDSVMKLRVLLVFCRYPQLRGSAPQIRQRLPCDPWMLQEALDGLAEASLLERKRSGGVGEYALSPRSQVRTKLRELAQLFDDPQQREEIYLQVREAEQERRFRDFLANERQKQVGGDTLVF